MKFNEYFKTLDIFKSFWLEMLVFINYDSYFTFYL